MVKRASSAKIPSAGRREAVDEDFSLSGRTALVTGAARRIGRSIALALAAEGAGVVVHYRSSRREAVELCTELHRRGARCWTVRADLAGPNGPAALLARARRMAGRIDFLVNNASIFRPDTIGDLTWGALEGAMRVNAWAPFVLGREFARAAGQGAIVNLLDSRLGSYDLAHAAYILSKHVLAVLTRMTALEFAPHVRVNAVAPGLILPPPGKTESYLAQMVNSAPLKRHGAPGDVAAAVVHLLRSGFVTGEVLNVDGGRHLHGGHLWTEA